MDFSIRFRAEVCFHRRPFDIAGPGAPPSQGCVIVVRACIGNGIRVKAVRQIKMRSGIAEAELQHTHAGKLQPVAQGMHLRGNVAQIFGNER